MFEHEMNKTKPSRGPAVTTPRCLRLSRSSHFPTKEHQLLVDHLYHIIH